MPRMPRQTPGLSRQDYCTPKDFLKALKRRLNIDYFVVDLAASKENAVAKGYFTIEDNAFTKSWNFRHEWAFCNPPFANIRPWVEKAWNEAQKGALIAMLVPASTGANWWADFAAEKAHVLFLNGRLTFVGETTPYPKDCAILLYTPFIHGGAEVWPWRQEPS